MTIPVGACDGMVIRCWAQTVKDSSELSLSSSPQGGEGKGEGRRQG